MRTIDADTFKAELLNAADLLEHTTVRPFDVGYILRNIAKVLDQWPTVKQEGLWPDWIRTAERKPTEDDANEDGCVLSINMNRGDLNTTNWPWNMVAAFPENLPVWMPLPKKPGLENLEGVKDGL